MMSAMRKMLRSLCSGHIHDNINGDFIDEAINTVYGYILHYIHEDFLGDVLDNTNNTGHNDVQGSVMGCHLILPIASLYHFLPYTHEKMSLLYYFFLNE